MWNNTTVKPLETQIKNKTHRWRLEGQERNTGSVAREQAPPQVKDEEVKDEGGDQMIETAEASKSSGNVKAVRGRVSSAATVRMTRKEFHLTPGREGGTTSPGNVLFTVSWMPRRLSFLVHWYTRSQEDLTLLFTLWNRLRVRLFSS